MLLPKLFSLTVEGRSLCFLYVITGRLVCETEPEGFRTEGISSKESVLSTWTEAKGTSMHGEINRGLLESNSTISDAVGLFVAVMFQHDCKKMVT